MKDSDPKAVGLRYDAEGSHAPRVVAKGRGDTAQRIVDLAREHGIPVERDADLVELLSVSELGDEIPTEVYGAVARMITFLWQLNQSAKG